MSHVTCPWWYLRLTYPCLKYSFQTQCGAIVREWAQLPARCRHGPVNLRLITDGTNHDDLQSRFIPTCRAINITAPIYEGTALKKFTRASTLMWMSVLNQSLQNSRRKTQSCTPSGTGSQTRRSDHLSVTKDGELTQSSAWTLRNRFR